MNAALTLSISTETLLSPDRFYYKKEAKILRKMKKQTV